MAEASAASTTMKARLGPSTRVKIKGRKRALASAVGSVSVGRGANGGRGGAGSTKVVHDEVGVVLSEPSGFCFGL